MKQYILPAFLLLLLLSSTRAFPQCAISGSVTDTLKAPAPFITAALLNAADSSIYKGVITDENGLYCFNAIKKGTYLLKISGVGFADSFSEKIVYDSASPITVSVLSLRKSGVNLGEVSVSAIRNPIEFKGGNITVNVEDSPLAIGNSVYDLIARLPGVMMDNDNISIQAKSGVKVYINDRVLQMSGAQLVNFLRSLSASSIEKIEIITNPPAKYDAAGSGGIINIRTKKIKITGFSGGINYTFSQGYYNNNNGGFSLNYKGRKITFFSNFNGYEGLLRKTTNFDKTVNYDSKATSLSERSYEIDAGRFLTAELGADWYINKKNTIGVKAQCIPGYAMRTYNGNTYMSDNSLGYDRLLFNRPIANNWYLANYNINAEHLFDTLGTKLKLSTDYYGPYYDIYKGSYQSRFIGLNGMDTLPQQIFRTTNSIGISVVAARLDFEKKFRGGLGLEAGVKQNYQQIRSDYTLENKNSDGDYITNSVFTNKFSYKEMISAGYVNLDKRFKKINVQLGLRGENTNIHTTSLTNSISYTRQYFNLFPVASLDYNPDKDHSLSLSYNRRINRPDYNSFNPFRSFVNLLNSSEGNPYLMPVYDNNISFNYVFKGKLSNSLSFAQSRNPIFSYTSQNDSTKETITHLANLDQITVIRYNLFIRQEITKWWTLSFLAGAYYINYNGPINNLAYSASAIPYYTRLNFFFLFRKDLKLEMSGFYWSPWLGGASTYQARGGVNFAIKKSFLGNALNLSVGVNDMFFTEPFRQKADFQNQSWQLYDAYDSRRLNLSVSYNFGKIKAQQRDTNGSDEVKSRMGR